MALRFRSGRFSFSVSRLLDNLGMRVQPREAVLVSPSARVFDILAEERARQRAIAEKRSREYEEKRREVERRFGYVAPSKEE